ncbi:hypothetical protein AVEN_57918-1 [Araneus ventricosus]|uniref:Uncharacterized protein n=1 Tax=Araneus ventricosus TaxID=182803 RepID=A0A4Y2KK36_ARAVE|nr:hypothetical protein AVEN_57918-1 [Araneus ventricosus]
MPVSFRSRYRETVVIHRSFRPRRSRPRFVVAKFLARLRPLDGPKSILRMGAFRGYVEIRGWIAFDDVHFDLSPLPPESGLFHHVHLKNDRLKRHQNVRRERRHLIYGFGLQDYGVVVFLRLRIEGSFDVVVGPVQHVDDHLFGQSGGYDRPCWRPVSYRT